MPAFSTRVPARRDDPPNQMRRTSLANMRPRRGALKSVKPARPVAQSGRSSTTSAKARNVSFAPGFRSGDPPNQVVGRAAVPNMQPRPSALKSAKRSWPTFHLPRVQPESGEEARRARIRARRLEQVLNTFWRRIPGTIVADKVVCAQEVRAEGGERGTAGGGARGRAEHATPTVRIEVCQALVADISPAAVGRTRLFDQCRQEMMS
ncbi:hypothetical protein PBRA_002147 [Plasmodiophora brassicae]|uniref:Uncharacterized protein n=1 Tax=Plasmodiophora brassicae TaxID=37360 RepID=A0A0G4J2M2_PLABS|nr:hypothetical protein PBRA_002147 [Plasmodiophora brassicae]